MGNATSAGLGSEAPHDQRDIRFARGHNSDTRPTNILLAAAGEAKRSEVILFPPKSNISEVPRLPLAFYSVVSETKESPRPPAYKSYKYPIFSNSKISDIYQNQMYITDIYIYHRYISCQARRIGRSRSSRVVDFSTNRKGVCDFLLIIYK